MDWLEVLQSEALKTIAKGFSAGSATLSVEF